MQGMKTSLLMIFLERFLTSTELAFFFFFVSITDFFVIHFSFGEKKSLECEEK